MLHQWHQQILVKQISWQHTFFFFFTREMLPHNFISYTFFIVIEYSLCKAKSCEIIHILPYKPQADTHLQADLGIEPYNRTERPRYRPKNPWVLTVFLTQSMIPLYLFAPPLFSSSCSCVLTYSVGKVMQISMPPVMPPGEAKRMFNSCFNDYKNNFLKTQPHHC